MSRHLRIALFAFLCVTSICPAENENRPNSVYIMANNLEYGDLGCFAQE